MSRCTCTSTVHPAITAVTDYETYNLNGGSHTGFVLFRCSACLGVFGFPDSNLDLALTEGTDETKEFLNLILTKKPD